MCSNFEPANPKQIEAIINKQIEFDFEYKNRVYPKDFCPIIIQTDNGLEVVRGQFGLSPFWASDPVDYSTYNARIETIEDKKTFKSPFTKSQFCLVPMRGFMEPYYLSGDKEKSEWKRIYREDEDAFTIAGMYEFNDHFSVPVHSFTLLTHNADDETFMSQFHKPSKEKRSIYLVDKVDRDRYLETEYQDIKKFMSIIDHGAFRFSDV